MQVRETEGPQLLEAVGEERADLGNRHYAFACAERDIQRLSSGFGHV